jgi:hypothetical protein
MARKYRIWIFQPKYDLVNMQDHKPSTPFESGLKSGSKSNSQEFDGTPYRQLVQGLVYLCSIRLGISFIVCLISRYMSKPHEEHWKSTKKNHEIC